ncbi:membrane protein [Rhodopirellula maiorica SM1]|uniref:Membrane protein n=1 Tax=Rhodopirellula maiorica SM1 TaxID=1265738 RepID=M5RAZ3_9BACT|nr:hypothetical protein [Rhodopirellula maiorica]EMI16658.1 membrane protein [Rhodopirellula maiorica SM1]
MENPYQPPAETAEPAEPLTLPETGPVQFVGGMSSVAAVGVIGGIVLMIALFSGAAMGNSPIMMILMLSVLGFASLWVVVSLLRGVTVQMPWKWVLPLLLTPIVFVLFLPVCTAGGFVTMITIGNAGYGPTMVGLSISVIGSFTLTIISIAAMIRSRYAARAHHDAMTARRESASE